MLIAAWHCTCNSAAPASLLRYGLRHRSNSGFAGTEPAEAPYAGTGIITHEGNDSIKLRGIQRGRAFKTPGLFFCVMALFYTTGVRAISSLFTCPSFTLMFDRMLSW